MCKKRLSRGKADPWQRPFYDIFWVPSCFEALFKFQKVLLKCFFRRISSRPCYCFAFLDTIFYVWSVARGKVRKLKKVSVRERKRKQNVIYTTFPFSMLSFALLDLFRFSWRHENISKWHCHFRTYNTAIFVPIAMPCVSRKFSSLNWNEFS